MISLSKNINSTLTASGSLAFHLMLALLVGLLPFAVSHTLVFPAQLGKTFVFLFALTVIGGLFVIYLLCKSSPFRVRMTIPDTVAFILFGYILINRYFIHILHGFSTRFFELLGLVFLYIILRISDRRYYFWFLLALVGGGFLQAIYGILQLVGFYPSFNAHFPMTGSFFNPGPYGGYLAIAFLSALGLYLFRRHILSGGIPGSLASPSSGQEKSGTIFYDSAFSLSFSKNYLFPDFARPLLL